jgi:hypothetical protein
VSPGAWEHLGDLHLVLQDGAAYVSLERGTPLATTGRLVVAGMGEIQVALAQGARCVEEEPVRNEPQNFTITGGTGA